MPVSSQPYPTTLLPPPSFTFDIEHQASTIRTSMTTGRARQRRRQTRERVFVNASWLFNAQEIHLFRSWFKDQINGGAGWFAIPLKLGHITRTFEMRFTNGFRESHRPVNHWEVSASLEIYDMQDCDYGEVEAAILYYWDNPDLPEFGGGYNARIPIVEQTVSKTLGESDDSTLIRCNASNSLQIVLPENVDLSPEWFVVVTNANVGEVEIVPQGAVVIDSVDGKRKINKQHTTVCIHFVGLNRFLVYGDLKS